MQLVIHAPFGGRINKAWGLALRKRFCRSFNFELQAAATDNGAQHRAGRAAQLSAGRRFSVPAGRDRAADSGAGGAGRRRSSARAGAGTRPRALALLRFQNGKKVPPQIQRIRSDDLLAVGVPRRSGVPGKHRGRHPDSRPSAGARGHERRAHRGHGYRRAAGAC